MKLIDIETGVEYSTDIIGRSVIEPTGKTYEVREAYGTIYGALGILTPNSDTHKFICFGELIEKPNPMPPIEAGDYLVWIDCMHDRYIKEGNTEGWCGYSEHYRGGKLLWSRENK